MCKYNKYCKINNNCCIFTSSIRHKTIKTKVMKTQKIANGTEVSYLNFSTGKAITETGIVESYAKDHKKYTVRKSDNSIAWVPESQITVK
jgi:hypothetical protein